MTSEALHPQTLSLKYVRSEGIFRLSLGFPEYTGLPEVVIELGADGGMGLMRAFQQLQAHHKIPIPASLRPQGRPGLSVVVDDGD